MNVVGGDHRHRIALLNVSHLPTAAETNFRHAFNTIPTADLTVYDTRHLELPVPGSFDAAIITGSIDSVNDDLEYIHALREWILASSAPTLGVCFGHQLIAAAFGGTVVRMPERELGYRRITLTNPSDPLFANTPTHPVVFQCHEDVVLTPPQGAEILATNEYGIQALRLGPFVSVQFHPEATKAHATRLLTELELPADQRRTALGTLRGTQSGSAPWTWNYLANFVTGLPTTAPTP